MTEWMNGNDRKVKRGFAINKTKRSNSIEEKQSSNSRRQVLVEKQSRWRYGSEGLVYKWEERDQEESEEKEWDECGCSSSWG